MVVNFDQPVTAPCAYRVTSNTNAAAVLDAEWIVGVLHGKGNLYLDSGLPGAPLSNAGVQLDLSVFKKYPGIHVVGYYQSQYAIGPEQQGVASLLSAHPDVNGLISQAYCTGAIAAFQAAGHALVPMVCAGVQRDDGCSRQRQGCQRDDNSEPAVPVGGGAADRGERARWAEGAVAPDPPAPVLLHRRPVAEASTRRDLPEDPARRERLPEREPGALATGQPVVDEHLDELGDAVTFTLLV